MEKLHEHIQKKEERKHKTEVTALRDEIKELRAIIESTIQPEEKTASEEERNAEANRSQRKKKTSKGGPAKALRNATWNNYVGVGVGSAVCFCCRLEPILQTNFMCGHVQSRAKGGKDRLENLRPVCMTCNSSMGTKDMEEFAEECGFRNQGSLRPLPTKEEEMLLEELYSNV